MDDVTGPFKILLINQKREGNLSVIFIKFLFGGERGEGGGEGRSPFLSAKLSSNWGLVVIFLPISPTPPPPPSPLPSLPRG